MHVWRSTFLALASTAVSICLAQQPPTQSLRPAYAADPASLPIALSKLKNGSFGLVDIEIIAERHAVQAIPQLETEFERNTDPDTKAKIANALVRLGRKDGPYWDYLAKRARQMLNDAPPTPFDYDANGKTIQQQPSRRFTEWAKAHGVSLNEAFEDAVFHAPGYILDLGSSEDQRAIPILRTALVSENHFVEIQAARGLAALHDTDSIQAIIHACENAPKEAASAIAASLVYFDNPVAQRAVDTYVPESTAKVLREGRLHGSTPYR